MNKKILFVCLGNICRSPAAEGIFKKMISTHGLSNQITCDSAGTSGYHAGAPADERMQHHAHLRGYKLESLSRPFKSPQDFEAFDLILTMDQSNYQNVIALDSERKFLHKVKPITDYCRMHQIDHVPDPYYKGDDGFEQVLDILEDACDELCKELKRSCCK